MRTRVVSERTAVNDLRTRVVSEGTAVIDLRTRVVSERTAVIETEAFVQTTKTRVMFHPSFSRWAVMVHKTWGGAPKALQSRPGACGAVEGFGTWVLNFRSAVLVASTRCSINRAA